MQDISLTTEAFLKHIDVHYSQNRIGSSTSSLIHLHCWLVNNNVQFHSVQSKHLKHDTHYDSIQYTFEYVFIVITLEIFCNYDTLHWWNMEQIAQLSLAHCLPRYLSFIHSDILVNIIFHFKKQKCGDVPYSFRDSWNQRLNLRNFYR